MATSVRYRHGLFGQRNHGASLAFYFDDPDGSMIEVYWLTGVKCRQPFIELLDLTQREEALRATLRLDDR